VILAVVMLVVIIIVIAVATIMAITGIMMLVATLIAMIFVVTLAITWDILAGIPVVFDKIDWPTASIIAVAIATPVPRVTFRYAQVDWRKPLTMSRTLDEYGAFTNYRGRRQITQINFTKEVRVPQMYGNANAIAPG